MNIEYLCKLPLFAGVEKQDLDWLLSMAKPIEVPAGHVLMREGDQGGDLYIVLEGEVEIVKTSAGQEVVIAVRGEGEVIGEISLLDQSPRTATVRATCDSHLLMITQKAFQELLSRSPSASLAILHTVTSRLRNTESMMRQNEKMAALGTLAAGLAHELNNPASAARRAAAQLREALSQWQKLDGELLSRGNAAQSEKIYALRQEVQKRALEPVNLDPLTRSDRESELQTFLEDRHLDDAWEITPALAAIGWDVRSLAQITAGFPESLAGLLARWLGTGVLMFSLLDEIGKSTERISEIVKGVKSYSYLDQAPIQEIDVHEGLENTLIILRHKLKNGIKVERQYDSSLPRIEAYASDLNQVWTNIIDNAIDAMNGKGELTIRTFKEDGRVGVEIADNGPGIPPEIQPRIFDPFFTTKPPGLGTGQGLNISFNIVRRHHGAIHVDSKPGSTVFRVMLPVRMRDTNASAPEALGKEK